MLNTAIKSFIVLIFDERCSDDIAYTINTRIQPKGIYLKIAANRIACLCSYVVLSKEIRATLYTVITNARLEDML